MGKSLRRKVGPRIVRGSPPEDGRNSPAAYRADYIRENELYIKVLDWRRPGAIWAMDHTESRASVHWSVAGRRLSAARRRSVSALKAAPYGYRHLTVSARLW